MSFLRRIQNNDRALVKHSFLAINAYCSRRSKSEDNRTYYEVGTEVRKLIEQRKAKFGEGGPNWEIFNPKGIRLIKS